MSRKNTPDLQSAFHSADPSLEEAFEAVSREHGVRVYPLELESIKPSYSIRLKCQVPLCEYYGVSKVCPPNIPDVPEFREAMKDYRMAFLVVYTERIDNIQHYRKDFTAERKLADAVSALEAAAYRHGWYRALGLCVGGCKLCPSCAGADEPCRHPFKARPSPEGFGIDVTELARNLGVAVEWPPRDQVNFLGLLFL